MVEVLERTGRKCEMVSCDSIGIKFIRIDYDWTVWLCNECGEKFKGT